eukprot:CAMPEP_0198212458 /NCGR_PEP_ID=MMETSP1445-20131203/26150_1 /TAXON_ID=36898 /ORGANISM="Pyramimonas sp., Strain CCMP2087" /LENGTH=188 /DNA_ID=CAMNT_0043886907 /DNA_START=74 /DNA_END=640 /DNA_ORIENTATION=-
MAASKVKGMLSEVTKLFRPPWRVTGPCAHPEYNKPASYKLFKDTQMPVADQYRLTHPGDANFAMRIPHADNDKVYDIRYGARDSRRAQSAVMGGVIKKGTRAVPQVNPVSYGVAAMDSTAIEALATKLNKSPETVKYSLDEIKSLEDGMPPMAGYNGFRAMSMNYMTPGIAGVKVNPLMEEKNNGWTQ